MKNTEKAGWADIHERLNQQGFAEVVSMLSPEDCAAIVEFFPQDHLFRSTIDMQRYRFGVGTYRYFTYPLPAVIDRIRRTIYQRLVPVANDWMERLGLNIVYPVELDEFIERCHLNAQRRATPLILRYEKGGYNTLHQDMYGEVFFPFQVVFMLSQPGEDFDGGELVFTEQLPRAQSRASVLRPSRGDAVIFTTNFRPVSGSRGYYRSRMKHGVSTVHQGTRYTLGLILHDAT